MGQVGAEFAREWLAHTLPGQNTHSSRLRAHALLQYTRVPTHACSQVTCRPDLVPSLHHPPGSWPGLAPCVSQRLSKIRKPQGAWEAARPPCGAQGLALTAELPSARYRPQGTPGCRGGQLRSPRRAAGATATPRGRVAPQAQCPTLSSLVHGACPSQDPHRLQKSLQKHGPLRPGHCPAALLPVPRAPSPKLGQAPG